MLQIPIFLVNNSEVTGIVTLRQTFRVLWVLGVEMWGWDGMTFGELHVFPVQKNVSIVFGKVWKCLQNIVFFSSMIRST